MVRVLEPVPVTLTVGTRVLRGDLAIPDEPSGVVVFAHGSGSGRTSPRNRSVAQSLVRDGLATLVFDLLTSDEDSSRLLRFDIPLLAARLVGAVEWVNRDQRLAMLPIGLFGASTGAAAALLAATRIEVGAVVSRGGRPDLATDALSRVQSPTLLVVGGADVEVLELNRRALQKMVAPTTLHIVAGATHLFEEPGTLSEVTRVASAWFRDHLAAAVWREHYADHWDH